VWLTFWIKEWDDAQLALGHIECMLKIMPGIGVLQIVKVNQVRPEDKAGLLKGSSHGSPISGVASA
jgi:hypothetical protein